MDNNGRGVRMKLAEFLHCKTAFISQVFNKEVNFSLEQAIGVNSFFKHSRGESKFFLLLLQKQRAGSRDLEKFFEAEIKEVLEKRKDLKQRLDIKDNLDELNQNIYYSAWYYAAIHILISIPRFQDPLMIANHLKLSIKKVHEVLSFLCQTGLAVQDQNRFLIGKTRIFLSRENVQIRKHLSNWRTQAVSAIEKDLSDNLHFSNVVSLSAKDIPKVQELLNKCIEECREIIKLSPEEDLRVMNIDFFSI